MSRATAPASPAPRAFLDTIYLPAGETLAPADDVVVWRCEEERAGDIRRWAALGCRAPNQTKAYGRASVGPCQERCCALTVSEILADAQGTTPAEVGTYRIRAPLKPITLGELAGLADDPRRPGVRAVDDVRAGYRLQHLRFYRRTTAGPAVGKPRHRLAFEFPDPDRLAIAALLQERRLVERQLEP